MRQRAGVMWNAQGIITAGLRCQACLSPLSEGQSSQIYLILAPLLERSSSRLESCWIRKQIANSAFSITLQLAVGSSDDMLEGLARKIAARVLADERAHAPPLLAASAAADVGRKV